MTRHMTSQRRKAPFATVGQAAEFLQVSTRTIRNWCEAKKLPSVRPGHHWRIPWKALEKLADTTASK